MKRNKVLFLLFPIFLILIALTPGARAEKAPRMDVVFLIDTTGSMGDEIAVVKKSLVDMISEIESGKPKPDVRFGLVLYRDRTDEYVTKIFKLTDDTDAIIKEVKNIRAAGGGDKPESVNEALHVAIHEINWDRSVDTEKTIYLIGDAKPHFYEQDYRWEDEIKAALDRYIVINSIGCSGLSSEGVDIFTNISKGSEGTFRYLTYRQEYLKADGTRDKVMVAGGSYYEMDDEAEESHWKLGADRAKRKGIARKMEAPTAGSALTGRGGPEGAVVGPTENNLDSILTSDIKKRMIEKGVKYGDAVEFDLIYSGSATPVKKEKEISAKNRGELNKLLKDYGIKKVKASDLDFKKYKVFGFVTKADGGFTDIKVKEVTIEDGVLNVTLLGIPDKGRSAKDTSKAILIAVPVTEKAVANYYFIKQKIFP